MLDAAAHGLGVALARPPLAQEQVATGRVAMVDPLTALNPVSYWLDRPLGGMRKAATALAARIAQAAGVAPRALAEFTEAEALWRSGRGAIVR